MMCGQYRETYFKKSERVEDRQESQEACVKHARKKFGEL